MNGVAGARRRPWRRLVRFFRQVVAELRKTVRPSRSELFRLMVVVVVFVAVVMVFVGVVDWLSGLAALTIFGA